MHTMSSTWIYSWKIIPYLWKQTLGVFDIMHISALAHPVELELKATNGVLIVAIWNRIMNFNACTILKMLCSEKQNISETIVFRRHLPGCYHVYIALYNCISTQV